MAEWLTHVLVAFVIASVLAWRYESITGPLVTAAMVGALLPDLRKIYLAVPGESVEATLGIPFSWAPLHSFGGIVICIAIIGILLPRDYRTIGVLMVSLGAFSHVFMDGLLYWPDGLAFEMFWPLTTYQIPVNGWYKSFDQWPMFFALGVALLTLAIGQLRRRTPADPSEQVEQPLPGQEPTTGSETPYPTVGD